MHTTTTNKKARSRNVAVARNIYVDDTFPLSAKTLYAGKSIPAKSPVETQPLIVAGEGDDSEALTIILDGDEGLTDGQGLDHNNDSESGLEYISNQNNATRGKNYNATVTRKYKVLIENRRGVIADTSIAGVRQPFDYQPLKLKQKSRATATTVSETSPVHTFADVYAKKASNDSENVTSDQNESFNFLADSTSCVVNSNGLLPRKKTNSTTTTLKGKYTVTRRSTKMLDIEGISKTTIGLKCHSKLL
ncbi:hypothetical protein Plhal304r1_c029g0095471 [Plasmopara halstedii]